MGVEDVQICLETDDMEATSMALGCASIGFSCL